MSFLGRCASRHTEELLDDIHKWLKNFPNFINDLETHLRKRIFKQRTVDIGVVSKEDALN